MVERAGIVLAAGEGRRMKSAKPKVMHAVAGRPILGHVIAAMRDAGIGRIVVVTSAAHDSVREYASSLGAESVVQEKPLGTGHAAACAAPLLRDFPGVLIVTYGDMPLVTGALFEESLAAQARSGMAIAAFQSESPGYGRILLDSKGLLDRIVEYSDATEAEKKIALCNAGLMAADAQRFFRWAAQLDTGNGQHEFYLTEIPALAKRDGVRCAVVECDAVSAMGVNSRAELAAAEAAMQRRLRARALGKGVGMIAPDTVFLSHDTAIGPDAEIGPYVVFGPGVTIGSGAGIRAFSYLEGAIVERGATVGPYARLRPGANIQEEARIGNFVEVKNSTVEKGAKANHLAYLGDARVGAGANIGAGTITCNYDGFDKRRTDIGAGAFIGSNTALVAPVTIGDGAYVGAGSTIARRVAKNALAVTRAEQKEIPGWAEKFRVRKKLEKNSKKDA